MEEVFVGAIGKADPEFPKSLEIIKDECPVQSSAVAGSTGIGFILQNAFGIPAVEAPRGIGSASACGTPVVIVFQIGVAAKIFGDDKVDVIVHIDDPLNPGPSGPRIGNERLHGIEGARFLRGQSAWIQAENFVILEAVIGCVVIVLQTLVEIVNSPVKSVQIQVDKVPMPSVSIPHCDHAIARPLVADHGCPGSLSTVAVVP